MPKWPIEPLLFSVQFKKKRKKRKEGRLYIREHSYQFMLSSFRGGIFGKT